MRRLMAVLAAVGFAVAGARAQTTVWNDSSGGSWATPGDWSNGVPTVATTAVINLAGTYTVTVTAGEDVNALTFSAANATLALTGGSIFLYGNGATSSLSAGTVVLDAASIESNGGAIGDTLNNATTIDVTGGSNNIYGNSNPFQFTNSGTINVTAGILTLGYYSEDGITNTGTIEANGSSAVVNVGSNSSHIDNSAGTVVATNNGTVTIGGASTVAWLGTSVGTITASAGGIVDFQGDLTFAQLSAGVINGAGGTLNLKGLVDLSTGNTLPAPASGIYTLDGGTIQNGVVDGSLNALGFGAGGGTLSNVTLNNGFTVPASAVFDVTNGTSFTGTSTFGAGVDIYAVGNAAGTALILSSTANWSGGMSVGDSSSYAMTVLNQGVFNHSTGTATIYGDGNPFTLDNSGTIESTSGTLTLGYYAPDTLTNTGTIEANGTGAIVAFGSSSSSLNNAAGTVLATNGGTVTIGGASTVPWLGAGAGTITASAGGIVDFQGDLTFAQLNAGVINGAGGTLNLKGLVDLSTGNTLPAPASGIYTLDGGTIQNGVVDGSLNALAFSSSGGTLSNVTLNNGFTVPASAAFNVTNGTSFTGTSTFGTNVDIYAVGTTAGTALTLTSTANWSGGMSVGDSSSYAMTIVNQGVFNHSTGTATIYGDGNPFTLDNSGTIESTGGTLTLGNYTPDTITNTGTIEASGAGTTVAFGNNSSSLNNAAGTVLATNGGTVTIGGASTVAWLGTSVGTITASAGGIVDFQGDLSFAQLSAGVISGAGGTLNLKGLVDLSTGNTLPAPASGIYTLDGGTIQNGVVDGSLNALAFGPSGGTLSNVTLNNGFTVPAAAAFNVTNGTSFTGTSTFGAGVDIYATGTTAGTALTLTSTANWSGGMSVGDSSSYAMTIVNQGVFTHSLGNGSIYGDGNPFTLNNSGTIESTGGTLTLGYYAPDTVTNTGTVEATGSGAIVALGSNSSSLNNAGGAVLATNGGTVTIGGASTVPWLGSSVGTITASAGGIVDFQGDLTFAQLNAGVISGAGGTLNLKGLVDLSTGNTLPAPGSGIYTLDGGTIQNGVVDGSLNALTFSSSGGTLSNVTLNNGFTVPASAAFNVTNGTSFTGTSTFGTNVDIYAVGTTAGTALTLTSTANWSGGMSVGDSSSYAMTIVNQGVFTHSLGNGSIYGDGNPFTLNNGGTIESTGGTLTLGYYAPDTVTNTGTVEANGSGAIVALGSNSSSLNNAVGAVVATNGGTVTIGGASTVPWLGSSVGTITASAGGIVDFQGDLTFAQLNAGVVSGAGGTLNLKGLVDLSTGNTLPAPASGIYTLDGGTIQNGVVDGSLNALNFSSSGGTLSNVTLNNGFTVPASAVFSVTKGVSFTGTSTFGTNVDIYAVGTTAGTALTLTSTANWSGGMSVGDSSSYAMTIVNQGVFNHSLGNGSIYGDGNPFTLSNSGTIESTGGNLTLGNYAPDTITNTGTVEANGATTNVAFGSSSSSLNNAGGTVLATNGGTVAIGGASTVPWLGAGAGTITASAGGIIDFQGDLTFAQLNAGVINGAGGTLNLKGLVDLSTGNTLPAPASGIYTLDGGTIQNGVVDGSLNALAFGPSGGTLSNVTLNNGFTVPASAVFNVTNGVSFTGTSTFGTNVDIYAVGTAAGTALTLSSTANWSGGMSVGDSSSYAMTIVNQGVFNHSLGNGSIYGDGNPFTLSNSGTIESTGGALTLGYYAPDTITNTGTVEANGSGAVVDFGSNSASLNNAGGTVLATNGGTVTIGGASTVPWLGATAGTVTASAGGTVNFGGSLTEAQLAGATINGSGGTLNLVGSLGNTGATLNPPASGIFTLAGGTITGGTVVGGALTFSNSGGTLSGVAMTGAFTLPAGTTSAYFYSSGATTFSGGTTTFNPTPGYDYVYLAGTGAALTVGSTATWNGGFNLTAQAASQTLSNLGTINLSGTAFIYGSNNGFTFTNGGTLTLSAGSLELGYYANDTFTDSAGGVVEANGGTIYVGNYLSSVTNLAAGTLTGGTWEATGGGILSFEGTSPITTNDATLVISGTTSSIRTKSGSGSTYQTLAQTLATNNGTLEVLGGQNFSASNAITNNGSIALGGGTFTTSGLTSGAGSSLSGTGTFAVSAGSLTIGSGVTVSPGTPAAGSYVGALSFTTSGSVVLGGGGTYAFDVANASGAAGTGYDTIAASGTANVTATPGTPFTIAIESINPGTGLPGAATFSSSSSYQWTLLSASALTNFNAADFTLTDSAFTNSLGIGHFFVSESGTDLELNFTPVPEPATWALLGAGAAVLGLLAWRRRASRTA